MENKELLDRVIKSRLEDALKVDVNSDEGRRSFAQAMEAIDRQIQLEKIEQSKEDEKKNKLIKIIEVAAVPTGLFVLDLLSKRYFIRMVCNFEKDYTFTTTAGKSLSSIFRFKR